MAYNSEKNERLVMALQHAAELVGDKKNVGGMEVGLGLTAQSNQCQEEAKAVRDGLFRVVVLGTFSCGKSTLINALIRSKVLPESPTPCTAILTYVQYGTQEDDVEIHMKGRMQSDGTYQPGEVRRISSQEFLHIYQYNNADNKEYLETGRMTRLEDVDYAVVRCSKTLMSNGVSIVDSPGMEDKAIATELAMDIFQKSQAIIYMSGERGFNEYDREFFATYFTGGQNNVFFVLNRFDLVDRNHREDVIENLRNNVLPCFTRPDGTVDVELMNKRVFCVSSEQLLDSNRGMTYDRDEQMDVPLTEQQIARKLELSQFVPFETALEEFLTTDEKCLAQYGKIVRTLLQTYKKAAEQVEVNLSYYDGVNQMTEEKRAECERTIRQIEDKIAITEASFDNCILKLQGSISDMLRGSIESVDKTWQLDLPILHEKIHFGMKSYVTLALRNLNFVKSKEEREKGVQELLAPFSVIIADHISEKIDEFLKKNQTVIDSQIREAEASVEENLNGITELFGNLGKTLSSGSGCQIGNHEGSWLQKIISCYCKDLSAVVKGYAGGKVAWMEFVRKTVFNIIWQAVVMEILTGGIGTITVMLIEWIQMKNGKNEMVDKMLTESKDGALAEIRQHLSQRIGLLNQELAQKVCEARDIKCKDARLKLADEQRRLNDILENQESNSFDAASERVRTETILKHLESETLDAYRLVTGRDATKIEDINI